MPKVNAEKKPRVRPSRAGYVMVELTEAQRAKLESLRDGRTRATGLKETMANTIRRLIMEAAE